MGDSKLLYPGDRTSDDKKDNPMAWNGIDTSTEKDKNIEKYETLRKNMREVYRTINIESNYEIFNTYIVDLSLSGWRKDLNNFFINDLPNQFNISDDMLTKKIEFLSL